MNDASVLAARLIGGQERTAGFVRALREWFAAVGTPPAAAFLADSPAQLLNACEGDLRPRAIELYELLETERTGHAPRRQSSPQSVWVALDRGGGGVALRLSTWRVDGPAGLASDARRHAWATRDHEFRRAEATASRVLEDRHPGAAVRYSLSYPDRRPYSEPIREGSFGAPLAVAALETVRRRSPFAVDRRGALTGALTSDGRIGSVEQSGLRGKALAARGAGARRMIVPPRQAVGLGGIGGIRIREAATVDEARRRLRVVRPLVKATLAMLVAAVAVGGLLVHELRADHLHDRQRGLAAERAMSSALAMVDSHPQTALQIAAAAARFDPGGTAPARSLLAAALPPDVRFLPDPPATVTALAWSRGGVMATTSGRLYRLERRRRRWRPGPAIPDHRLAAFSDPDHVAVAGRKGAWLVAVDDGGTRRLTKAPVREVAGGGGVAACLTRKGTVIVADADSTKQIPVTQPTGTWSVDRIVEVAVTPGGKLVAGDRLGRVFNRVGDRLVLDGVSPITPKLESLTALAAGGGRVIAAGEDGEIDVIDPELPDGYGPTGAAVSALVPLPGHRGAAIRSDGAEVFVTDGTYSGVRTEQRLGGRYRAVAASPDGRHLIVAGREAAVLRLDRSFPSPFLFTQTISFDRAGHPLGLSSEHGGAMRLRAGSPSVLVPGPKRVGEFSLATVSPNGHWATYVGPKGRIRRLDLWSGKARTFTARHATYDARIEDFFIYPGVLDDGRLALGEDTNDDDEIDGVTYLFDPEKDRTRRLHYDGAGPFARQLGPGRLLIASGDHLDLVRLRDMTLATSVTAPGAYINTIAASASGRMVFFGTSSGDLWSWTPAAGKPARRLGQVDGAIISLVSNRNGSVLFGTTDRGLRKSSRVFAVDVPNRNIELLEVPDNGSTARATISPDQDLVAISASRPVGAVLLSARLAPREACARAGGEVPAAAWREAIGGLPVPAPSCADGD